MGGVFGVGVPTYLDLVAWQKAMKLALPVYDVTHTWPRNELYGLTSQTRRATLSVATYVAVGKRRLGAREFHHHLSIAHGSLCEAETCLLVAKELDLIDATTLESIMYAADRRGWTPHPGSDAQTSPKP